MSYRHSSLYVSYQRGQLGRGGNDDAMSRSYRMFAPDTRSEHPGRTSGLNELPSGLVDQLAANLTDLDPAS
jgi:hypothetical protein